MTYKLVVVGTSLGGLGALKSLLSALSADFGMAMAIVQHRSRGFGDDLALTLSRYAQRAVEEIEDKMSIESGHIYLAPADYHVLVQSKEFALSTDAPVSYSRPSIDVLFESAADGYGRQLIGVILTGSSDDGVAGARYLEERGGLVVIQDPLEAEAKLMPRGAIAATKASKVLSLQEISGFLNMQCQLEVG